MDEKTMKIWDLLRTEEEFERFFQAKGVLPKIATCDNNNEMKNEFRRWNKIEFRRRNEIDLGDEIQRRLTFQLATVKKVNMVCATKNEFLEVCDAYLWFKKELTSVKWCQKLL